MVAHRGRVGLALLGTAVLLIALVWSQRVVFAADVTVATCTNAGLQAAIASASPGDRIIFNCATPLIPITTTLTVDKSLAFDGTNVNPSGPIILDGGGATRIMNLSSNVALTLTTITLQRGNAGSGDGGAVNGDNTTTVWLSNTLVLSNTAWYGGGLRVGAATVISSSFLSNTAGSYGGGFVAVYAATVSTSSFVSNTAGWFGGGLSTSGQATVTGTQFVSNTAGSGGGLYANGEAAVTASRFVGNSAVSSSGGGLSAFGATLVTSTQFLSNTASKSGGGLYAYFGGSVSDTQFLSNAAGSYGGGLYANGAATVISSSFLSNAAGSYGGGLYANGAATVSGTQFLSNTAGYDGGGLWASGAATVSGTQFLSNTAAYSGGGLFASGAATVSASHLLSNAAGNSGGGLYAGSATLVTGAQFLSNTAGFSGGGLYASGAATVTASSFLSNTAGSYGGGLYANSAATVSGSSFVSNTAVAYSGGGLYASGAATVTASSFLSNTAQYGGGFYTYDATVTGTQFLSNTAGWYGGGFYAGGMATVSASHFLSNTAQYGGGFYTYDATVTTSSFVSNTAGQYGGGFSAGTATITGAHFLSNTAVSEGGGGLFVGGDATIAYSSLVRNTASHGGGLWTYGALTITNSTLSANTALTSGGAISLSAYSPVSVTLAYVTIISNTAPDAAIAAASAQVGAAHGVVLQQGATGANCQQVTFPGATGLVATETSCGNASSTSAASIALGPLANNGGATLPGGQPTLTHLPAPTSVLVAGVACLPGVPTDQRGFARPPFVGGPCDIGAVQTVPTITLTSVTPNTAPAASPATVVTVTGSGFLTVTQALVNGLGAPTTVVSPTQLSVTINAADLAAAGVLTVSAQYGADASTRSNSLPFTVTLTSQTITFPNPGAQSPTSFPANLPVTATATSGLPVTLTSQTTGVCAVSGFTVTLLTGGTCTLVANQGGNSVYAPASPVTQTFTINPLSQTITFPNPGTQSPTSLPSSVSVTATASSGLPVTLTSQTTGVCTVSGFTVTLLSPGLCTLVANQGGNAVYAPASPVTQTFTINPLSQTITFPNPGTQSPTSLPSSVSVTATASSGLPVTLTSQTTGVCTVSGFTVTLLTPGLCTLVANQGGNSVYAPASPVTQTFAVSLLTQTITFPNPGNQNPVSLPSTIPVTATASSGLPVTLTSQTTGVCSVSGFTVTLLTGGTCTLVANQGGNSVYAPASPVTQTFAVSLLTQTITFPNPGTQNPASLPSTIPVTATASSGLPVTLTSQTTGVCTVSGFTVTLLTGGTCTLVANQGGNSVYAPASPVTQSFTVNAPSGGGGGGGTTPAGGNQIVIATGFRNRPMGQ